MAPSAYYNDAGYMSLNQNVALPPQFQQPQHPKLAVPNNYQQQQNNFSPNYSTLQPIQGHAYSSEYYGNGSQPQRSHAATGIYQTPVKVGSNPNSIQPHHEIHEAAGMQQISNPDQTQVSQFCSQSNAFASPSSGVTAINYTPNCGEMQANQYLHSPTQSAPSVEMYPSSYNSPEDQIQQHQQPPYFNSPPPFQQGYEMYESPNSVSNSMHKMQGTTASQVPSSLPHQSCIISSPNGISSMNMADLSPNLTMHAHPSPPSSATSSSTVSQNLNIENQKSVDEKKKERNRIAAAKCRELKNERIKKAEAKVEEFRKSLVSIKKYADTHYFDLNRFYHGNPAMLHSGHQLLTHINKVIFEHQIKNVV